ncbi:unnamed protein product [Sordaria macrospora k-hell]|uniref:WGS project CABT00000000 data, contig 2.19 n=1 Tax=Sordaria macrospora (strain ATCC MYA-333 / DSM 997 / K(L3346) / K-hell) TaxID=771870 RepID=F7W1F9_SORMK|nr:uncharacterized protein SMAC_04301 [Sordaria macrospora k-hell]CCC04934.1 unnamed protein product [Sordaria macrospora k-hell]
MSSTLDELLQDFEDSGSEAGGEEYGDGLLDDGVVPAGNSGVDDAHVPLNDEDVDEGMGEGEDKDEAMGGVGADDSNAVEDPEEAKAKVEKMHLGGVRDVRTVATLMNSLKPVLEVSPLIPLRGAPFEHGKAFTSFLSNSPDSLDRTLQKIAHYQAQPAQANDFGHVEDHPEYNLLTNANRLSTLIDSEVALVHKFVRDHFSARFAALESLLPNPIEYCKVVAILGNSPMDSESMKALQLSTDNPLGLSLKSVLDGPTLMIVTVEATVSKGQFLGEEEVQRVTEACLMVVELDKAKKTLTDSTAPQPGWWSYWSFQNPGLQPPGLGSKKQTSSALATNVGIRQQGFIYQSDIVRGIPTDLKKQAMKMFANKIVMCARTDCFHQFRDGSEGERLKDECLDRLDKLQQKPNSKGARALPAPDDKPSRKRGGRRARKAKEATAMTELRKAQNRMAFGKEENEVGYGQGDSTAGMGMIGQRDDGRLRVTQIDQRTRAKLSAKSKGWGGASSLNGGAASSLRGLTAGGSGIGNISLAASKGLRTSGVGTTVGSATAGTVSSLAFTPMQGLELVDPKVQSELSRKRKADEDRWFKGGTFTQVGNSGGGGEFKKPALPAAKRQDTGATK